ncbi:MAG: sigma-54-dependent Fis family transcriptional regulator [Candidatus Acididesulfobacter guangdongensis]|uniref:Sigma-54-dependent Fis family transcriptional regulator n=1 Tax=Acididesulfobacter guangdongensis TaxID=2597225 RepID=A0A519BEC1_ACIG2|nr:MAG: sigma-54-dependent Fis family transcriptional regulator [Candidatus Acididesulfobacter guangdongensis]
MSIKNGKKILIIDDEKSVLDSLEILLKYEGYEITALLSAREALKLIADNTDSTFNLIISDISMPDISGIDFLCQFKDLYLKNINYSYTAHLLPVILMTAYSDVKTAVNALKEGAFDYLIKPFDTDEFKITVKKAVEYFSVYDELNNLKNKLVDNDRLRGNIVGDSAAISKIITEVNIFAKSFSTMLITGESGTGKELAAKLAHDIYFNKRSDGKHGGEFVPVNLSAIPENLIESELFGYTKGAFTGANYDKKGILEYADKGTLFLDEIGDLPMSVQVKLLRVLQEKTFRKIGSNKEYSLDIRFIAATNKDLNELIRRGEFREDLFFRLNAIHIEMPPLRKHKEDIPLLVSYFIGNYSKKLNKNIAFINQNAVSILADYDYPGNIRELENLIERACIYCRTEEITENCLPDSIKKKSNNIISKINETTYEDILKKIIFVFNEINAKNKISLEKFIDDIEKNIIIDRMENKKQSKKLLAKELGLSARSLRYIVSKIADRG